MPATKPPGESVPSYLLVERYDRVGAGKDVRRLHQEDFCQALGRPPAAKYEFNGTGIRGPSIADMFALVRQHMTARDITRLLDAVIFNVAIGTSTPTPRITPSCSDGALRSSRHSRT